MFEPVRGGTRGGQAEFKWSDVSADKDRENYLGHSINAPTGRWQRNKDIHWYNRDVTLTDVERAEEIRKIKEAEAEALSVALGFGPAQKSTSSAVVASSSTANNQTGKSSIEFADETREERKRKKTERKEEKRARKEKRRLEHASRRSRSADREDDDYGLRRRRDRSRSPRRRSSRDRESRSRSRDRSRKQRDGRERSSHDLNIGAYSAVEREKERERDRRLWDLNARRDRPFSGR